MLQYGGLAALATLSVVPGAQHGGLCAVVRLIVRELLGPFYREALDFTALNNLIP